MENGCFGLKFVVMFSVDQYIEVKDQGHNLNLSKSLGPTKKIFEFCFSYKKIDGSINLYFIQRINQIFGMTVRMTSGP